MIVYSSQSSRGTDAKARFARRKAEGNDKRNKVAASRINAAPGKVLFIVQTKDGRKVTEYPRAEVDEVRQAYKQAGIKFKMIAVS